jgi:hypothetical protein
MAAGGGEVPALVGSLTEEDHLKERFGAALAALDRTLRETERTRLPGLLDFVLDLGLIGVAVDKYGRELQTEPFKSARRQLVERWQRARDNATRRQIVRDAEDLARSAAEILRSGAGTTSAAEEVRHAWRDKAKQAGELILPSAAWLKTAGLVAGGLALAGAIFYAATPRAAAPSRNDGGW